MTVGRWLLIHSFSIFLVVLFLLGYVFREELQLEQAYRQLMNGEKQSAPAATSPRQPPPVARTPDLKSPPASRPEPLDTSVPAAEPAPRSPDPAAREGESPHDPMLSGMPTVSIPVIELDDRLYQARKAYWDGDYQLAIRLYQQLIEDDGDNADYIGELGNIYFAVNDFDNAARQFYQAAIILNARGKREQARLLVSPITAMDRDLGDELRQRLR